MGMRYVSVVHPHCILSVGRGAETLIPFHFLSIYFIFLLASARLICVVTLLRSFSIMMGLLMKSLAPSWNPFEMSCSELRAERMMMGRSFVSSDARRRRMTSNPSIPGIMRSRRRRSGFFCAMASRAACPPLAVRISKVYRESIYLIRRKFRGTSSTISTERLSTSIPGAKRLFILVYLLYYYYCTCLFLNVEILANPK